MGQRLAQISPLNYRGGIVSDELREEVSLQRELPLAPVFWDEGAQRDVPPEHLVVVALAGGRQLWAQPAHALVGLQVGVTGDQVLGTRLQSDIEFEASSILANIF